jgi:hypothetical protein
MAGLSHRKLKIARAVAASLFDPGTGAAMPVERMDWLERELKEFTSYAGPKTTFGLGLALVLIQWLPLFMIGKLGRFTRLAAPDQLRVLEAFERSRLLSPLLAVTRILLSLLYFERADVMKEAGLVVACRDSGTPHPLWGAP